MRLISFFLIILIVNLVNALGHALVSILNGGKLNRISLGNGKILFKIGIIEVKQLFFSSWLNTYSKTAVYSSIGMRIFANVSGLLAGFVLSLIIFVFIQLEVVSNTFFFRDMMVISFLNSILHLIPAFHMNGRDIILMQKQEELKKNPDDRKAILELMAELDKEIEVFEKRTKIDDIIGFKYYSLVRMKASIYASYLVDYSSAIETLSKIDANTLSNKNLIIYYNDYLYYLLQLNQMDEAKAIFDKLKNYTDTEEYEDHNIKDTIATYYYYNGNLEESERLFREIVEHTKTSEPMDTSNYYLSKILSIKGNTVEATRLLQRIDISKSRPCVRNKIIKLKNGLGV